jgi:hypothetical protein
VAVKMVSFAGHLAGTSNEVMEVTGSLDPGRRTLYGGPSVHRCEGSH